MKLKVLAYGIPQAVAKASKQSGAAAQAFVRAMVYEAEKIMTKSQEIVPVKTGNLKGTKFIRHETTRNIAVSTLGYRAQYAIFVHEMPPSRIKAPGGQSQYLRTPLDEAIPGLAERVAEAVKKETGG